MTNKTNNKESAMETLIGIYTVLLLKWTRDEATMTQRYNGVFECGPRWYEPEYKLQASSREEVFEVLNIRQPADYRRRSLSVGDLVIDPEGNVWLCGGCGWKNVTVPYYRLASLATMSDQLEA